MSKNPASEHFNSRYVNKKFLGAYPPWQGFSVEDSLSDKKYFLFSLPPSYLSLSLEDLKMRDYLFSRENGMIAPALTIQRCESGITFLMPHTTIVPITKALPSMKPQTALKHLVELATAVLSHLRTGLLYHNLTPKSVVMINTALRILPTAYLLPAEMLAYIENGGHTHVRSSAPLNTDLRHLGDIFEIFSRYFDSEPAAQCKKFAARLQKLDAETDRESFFAFMDELVSFLELKDRKTFTIMGLQPCYEPPERALRILQQAASQAKRGVRHLIVVEGKNGEGKTSFLHFAARMLEQQLGFEQGALLSDQDLHSNIGETADTENVDFVLIDDHSQEALLCACMLDRVCSALEQCPIAILVLNEKTPRVLSDAIGELKKHKEVSVTTLTVPPHGPPERRRALCDLVPTGPAKFARPHADSDLPLAISKTNFLVSLQRHGRSRNVERENFLSLLTPEEKSVLTFLAVFRFEIPLSILQHIYSTAEDGIHTILHNLTALGLVDTHAEKSVLAGGDLCLVYHLASNSLSEMVLAALTPERLVQMHDNIVLILKEIVNAPHPYIYFHLAGAQKKNEAAMKGFELFHLLLKKKCLCAINCFNESFLQEKLDQHLPPDIRFKLLLELGNYFSLIGNLEKAENLYRRCRKETQKKGDVEKFRALSVEAVRRESEILEKKGEFIKAQKLLEEALASHGEHIMSNERSKLYNDLAWVHYRLGAFDKSWENCLIVHKLLDKKQYPREISQAYNMMGAINWNRSNYEEAILCYKKCLSLREDCNDEIGVAASFNNLGLVYRDLGKVRKALECFKKSMELKQRNNNLPGLAAVHLNIALAYLDGEKIEEAEENCLVARRLAEDIGNQQLLAELYGTMGEIHFLRGELDEAKNFYFQDLHMCERTSSVREKAVVFRRLGELNLREGKIDESTDLLEKAKDLNRQIGSRLETCLLNVLEGRILVAEGKREQGKRLLEGSSLELSLLGRKIAAASIAAEIGELCLEEGNEQLAREYLLRGSSLVGEGETPPSQITRLLEKLDSRQPLSLAEIHSDSERFRALCRITSLIRTTQDPETLYSSITDMARQITGMKRAALVLQSNGNETYRILASGCGFDVGSVITDENIIAILNIARQLGYPLDISRTAIPAGKVSGEFLARHRGIICIPLWIQDEVTGYLYLDSDESNAIPSDEDHSFLLALSQQLALGLERNLLSQKITDMNSARQNTKQIPVQTKERPFIHDIIGESPAMRNIFELIAGIKEMDTTVLLTGPNGTGKDKIAKVIHYSSHRGEKPFVSLNTAAFPRDLLESELFGHEKGSFTGAHRLKIGHFEAAEGGTLFLNEIGDMPLELQPKLLRVLEEQKFYRVGGTREVKTNVRIITATNKDLLALVKQGNFREDLFYRINIFPIRVPALKERKEDIEPLCNHFLTMHCQLYNIPIKQISPEAMTYIANYPWPGNVRELENMINRLIIITKKDTILPEDLPDNVVKRRESQRVESSVSLEESIEYLLENTPFSKSDPLLPKVEGMLCKKVVDKTNDKTKAAGLLGISKPTLYSKLRNHEKNQ